MDVSRRSFLGGALTVAAVAVAPKSLSAILPEAYPVLHGDAQHDDTAALNALFSGKPVLCEGEVLQQQGGTIRLHEGSFKVSDTVTIWAPEGTLVSVYGCYFEAAPEFRRGASMIKAELLGGSIRVNTCSFVGTPALGRVGSGIQFHYGAGSHAYGGNRWHA